MQYRCVDLTGHSRIVECGYSRQQGPGTKFGGRLTRRSQPLQSKYKVNILPSRLHLIFGSSQHGRQLTKQVASMLPYPFVGCDDNLIKGGGAVLGNRA